MFKSIFRKLLVTNLIIIAVIISSISLILPYVYSQYVFLEKERTLRTIASKVEHTIGDFYDNRAAKKELEATLNAMGYVEDASIYVLKLDKDSLADPATLKLSDEPMEGYLIQDLKLILNGNTVFRRKQYTKAFDTVTTFLGMPLRLGSDTEGAILVFSPISQISGNITKMNLIILSVALLAVAASALVIYLNASRISKPIKVMDIAAKKIAAGEATGDLPVTCLDEVGQLAETFNYMKNKLEETENIRREFIANVSHDLRTPLTSINGLKR